MQRNDVAFLQQLFKRYKPDEVRLFSGDMALISQHLCTKGVAQSRCTAADGSGDAHCAAAQLTANQTILGLTVAAALLHCGQVAQQRKHHAHRQLCDRLGGISCCIADLDAHFFGSFQIHMVHAGECHVDEAQLFAGADDPARQRHIGDDEDVGILCPLNLHLFIGIFLIADKLMSLFFQLLGKSAQYFLGNSQRFQQYDFHTSFLL